MGTLIHFRFYEELNDFLPAERRKVTFSWSFSGQPSVKFAMEALGVPHTEVDLILVNGISVDFSYRIHTGDLISVYPVFESLDITPVLHLRVRPLRRPRFIADAHLGRLARDLRLFGFDTLFSGIMQDTEIIYKALQDKRTILTRDREMLKNKQVTRGYWLRSQNPREQLQEVIERLDLRSLVRPFTRCTVCNGILVRVPKSQVADMLKPLTRKNFNQFWQCPDCRRVYWKGSHYQDMVQRMEF